MSIVFNNNKAIYLQISDGICDKILLGEYPDESKIPSIRQTAVALEVNPNTVQRSYEWLQQQEIIFTKRGLGYFTNKNALEKVMELRKKEFVKQVLPQVFKNMEMLKISIKDLEKEFIEHTKNKENEN